MGDEKRIRPEDCAFHMNWELGNKIGKKHSLLNPHTLFSDGWGNLRQAFRDWSHRRCEPGSVTDSSCVWFNQKVHQKQMCDDRLISDPECKKLGREFMAAPEEWRHQTVREETNSGVQGAHRP